MKNRDIYDVACDIANRIVQIKASRMSFSQLSDYFRIEDDQMSDALKDRDTIYRFILGYLK